MEKGEMKCCRCREGIALTEEQWQELHEEGSIDMVCGTCENNLLVAVMDKFTKAGETKDYFVYLI